MVFGDGRKRLGHLLAAGLRRPHIPWEAPRADYETALAAQRRLNRSASAFPADALDQDGDCDIDYKSNTQETKSCKGSTCAASCGVDVSTFS